MAAAKICGSFLFLILSFSVISLSCQAQSCNTHKFSNGKTFAACSDLPVLDSSLHWNYYPSTHTVDIAFRHAGDNENRWVAWAINPTSKHMIGSQALVALRRSSDGSLTAYTSPVTSYRTLLQPGNLSFPVHGVSALYDNNEIVIFATLELPGNSTVVNHLWQEGPLGADGPMRHGLSGDNMKSYGTLDFISGKIETPSGLSLTTKMRIVHGVLNALSWGFLMPVGVVIARYVKVFPGTDPAWFYIHVSCQCAAYVVGLAGLIMGFWLGSQSSGVRYSSHANIGISLIILATTQIIIAMFRPGKEDKNRIYFNVFHHSIGYATIVLGITNCFIGITIINSLKTLIIYAAIIGALVFIVALLEIVKFMVNRRKSKNSTDNLQKMETTVACPALESV